MTDVILRVKPLRCGYIGDGHSGGLVLRDPETEQIIDLGVGIDAELAHHLSQELESVLRKIHEAQRRVAI